MKITLLGVTDPHIHVFEDTAYLYASHDHLPDSERFDMRDWQVWSSTDLIDWEHRSTLTPEETYLGEPIRGCWATDALFHNDFYYWFFSEVREEVPFHQIGVVRSRNPDGPWEDYLNQPIAAKDAAPVHVYDPCVYKENGRIFMIFGAWDYYLVELNPEVTGFLSDPGKIEINDPEGPYGKGKTDDKVFLHKRKDTYYLSWGVYYAVSKSLEGPYQCMGSFLKEDDIDPSMRAPTWPHGPTQGRHGSFFSWKGKDYFCYCDMSHSGNCYYRSWWLSEIEYTADGLLKPIKISVSPLAE